MMKKILLLTALMIATLSASAYTYETTLSNAHWDFEDTTNVRPTASAAAFFVPNNWKTGSSITAYMPYVYPNGNQASDPNRGYQSRHCLFMNKPNGTTRLPVYAMMPKVTDKNYSQLKLQFYARTYNSSLDTQTSNTIYGDWQLGYLTDLADTVKANFTNNVTNITTINLTADWTLYSYDLTDVPNGAYMVLYTAAGSEIRYMYVDNVAFVENSTTPSTPSEPTITYNLTGCTGDADNATEWDNDEGIAELAFTLDAGYEWASLSVVIDGVAVANMMDDMEADPSYVWDPDEGSLYIYYLEGDVEDGVVVTITAARPAIVPVPGIATFEEYADVLPAAGDKYNPWEADGTHSWQSGDYTFHCTRSYSGMMNDGFFAANWTDTIYRSYSDDYKVITASAKEGSCYASMYYSPWSNGKCNVTFAERTVNGTYVTLALNPYLCIYGKNSIAKAFAEGDFFYLRASGKKNGVYTNTTVDFYLADFRDGKRIVVDSWQWMSLAALGSVDEIEFVLYDSQSGAGIGSYCCMDNFGDPNGVVTAISEVENTIETEKLIINGRVLIRRGNQMYDMLGREVR